MRILSDCPERLDPFVGPRAAWARGSQVRLDASDRELWEALGEGADVATLDFPHARPEGFWARAILLADAKKSRFDALQESLGAGLGLPGPIAVVALRGSGFRGQRERRWAASPGNLFLTVGLAPHTPAARVVPGLTMLPAVATVDAIRALPGGSLRPGIKWVNDVLVDGRKVAGVLTATHLRDGRVESAVLGIGVNVASAPAIAPTPFVPQAGCLHDSGARVDRATILWGLLGRLARRYQALIRDGGDELLRAYREAAVVVGQRVRIWAEGVETLGEPAAWPAPLAAGIVGGIGPDLALHLEGRDEPVRRGRLALETACASFGI